MAGATRRTSGGEFYERCIADLRSVRNGERRKRRMTPSGGFVVNEHHGARAAGDPTLGFLESGGVGGLIRSMDWSRTAIGAPDTWSPALRTLLRILLANRFPMLVWWGPEYIQMYNDAYVPIPGAKHPQSLGQPAIECWKEIWHILKPLIDTPFLGGPATWIEDLELEIQRAGFTEETHFTVAYSAVPDETAPNGVGGVLATVHEITEKIVGGRRLVVLRDLGAGALEAKTAEEACAAAAGALAAHTKDVPFALLYLSDADGRQARLVASCGVDRRTGIGPSLVDLDDGGEGGGVWPLAAARRTGRMQVADLSSGYSGVPRGSWSDPPNSAAVLPIRFHIDQQVTGFLVAGLSPRLKLDDGYKNFLNLATGQIATAIAKGRAYEDERRRAEALEELDRAKTAFFSNVSHEFRTPLTLMLGPLENVLAQSGSLAPGDREQIEIAHRNSLRLLKLVNSLLDFSRIEAGRLKASYAPVDLAAATAELASTFRSAIEAAGMELIVDCAPLPEPVYVDCEMWEKIVLNLLSNAFKFTLEGSVTVQLRAIGDSAVLKVSDTGIGISGSELPHIFERFHRVDSAKGRTYEGTGIGLALVQELVKLHGGSVSATSAPGAGSAFTVSIPFGTAHLPPERIGSGRSWERDGVRPESFTGEALTWLSKDVRDRQGADAGKRGRVLVADDNSDMRDHVARILGEEYDLTMASDGKQALEAIQRDPPDLVLTDVMMPNLDGVEMLRAVRANPATRSLPVIFLSARAGEEARVEGLEAGADDYLVKPFAARELLARVRAGVKMQGIRKESESRLRESEERFRTLANNISQFAWMTDEKGWIFWYNQRWFDYTGTTLEEMEGWGWQKVHHPDHVQRVTEHFKQAIESGELWEDTFPLRGKDGRYRWFLSRALPIRDAEGRVLRWFGTNTDITGQLDTERELRRANADLEQFAYSASHDLQEPLRSVKIYSELLSMRYSGSLDAGAMEYLSFLNTGATRMETLIHDLVAYLRVSKLEAPSDPSDANEAVREALKNLSEAIAESEARISVNPLPVLPVHRIHLEQLFQNLVGNAIKYRGRSKPNVSVTAVRENETWLFTVEDNGIGIEREYKDYIFELFKRLHSGDEYSGTGLGLAICQRIVERYHGRIWVESRPGEGSTFYFTLPA